jgi:hypothetical protein
MHHLTRFELQNLYLMNLGRYCEVRDLVIGANADNALIKGVIDRR